jgi:hypothetical protein
MSWPRKHHILVAYDNRRDERHSHDVTVRFSEYGELLGSKAEDAERDSDGCTEDLGKVGRSSQRPPAAQSLNTIRKERLRTTNERLWCEQ